MTAQAPTQIPPVKEDSVNTESLANTALQALRQIRNAALYVWKNQKLWLLLAVLVLIIFARPFSWFWETWTMPDSALSFQPLVPLGAAWLAWMERDQVRAVYNELASLFPADSPKRRGKLWPVLVGCALVLAAMILATPPLAMLALLTILVGLIYYIYGPFIVKALQFPLLFLLTMAPIPSVLVGAMTQRLQLGCTAVAGKILALFYPDERTMGNFIHLPGFTLEVAGPCSGVSILLPVMVMTLWLSLYRRMRLLPSLLLITIGAIFSLVMNVLRIVVMGLVGVHNRALANTLHDMNSLLFTALAFYLTFLAANMLMRRWNIALPERLRRKRGSDPQAYYNDIYSNQFPTVGEISPVTPWRPATFSPANNRQEDVSPENTGEMPVEPEEEINS